MTHVSSLYLHVPFCQHLCNYCDFYKRKLENPAKQFEDFHQFLEASVKRHQALMREAGKEWEPLETIYLGGGTPSLWGSQGSEFLRSILPPKKLDAEFTMEVDPGTWTPEMIESWKAIGMNRISIGTQTLDPDFLKIMDRIHSVEESQRLLEYCQKNSWNFSLDFLLGIPHSKDRKRDIQAELDLFLSYHPKHVSLYILNARSKYPLIRALPDDEYIREEYLFVSEYLSKKGFHHYEVSNFALPGFESHHNLKYWRSESVAALGPTGTGLFRLSDSKALRYKWKVSSAEVELEHLGAAELELERTYLELRTSVGWKPTELKPSLKELFLNWHNRGLGTLEGERMKLNAHGFVVLDSLMNELFMLNLA